MSCHRLDLNAPGKAERYARCHARRDRNERSNCGEILKKNGALISSDPYPEEHFFQRSDNYSLALQGIVAHTVSGWAVVPTYHQPTDTVANLNIPFMTTAIQSLINPLRAVANGSETPQWKAGGRPSE